MYIGHQPYGIFKFAGISDNYGQPGGGGWTTTLQNVHLDQLDGELIGNAVIWDDNQTVAAGGINTSSGAYGGIFNTLIDSVYFTWASAQEITTGGRANYAFIGAPFINGLFIRTLGNGANNFYPPNPVGSMLAGIVTGGIGYSSGGIDISGDMPSLLPQYTTAKVELVGKLPAGSPGCQSVGLHFPGVWDGGMIAITSAGTTVSVGQVLQVSNSQGAVVATGGAPVLGVAMGTVATSATGSCVPYANRGFVTATATGTPTEGALLVANSAGTSTTVTATGGCTVGIEQNPPYNAIYLAPGGFIPDLTTGVITSGTISGAAVIKTAQPIDGLIFGSNVGTAIASASTIAPTTGTVHVTALPPSQR